MIFQALNVLWVSKNTAEIKKSANLSLVLFFEIPYSTSFSVVFGKKSALSEIILIVYVLR